MASRVFVNYVSDISYSSEKGIIRRFIDMKGKVSLYYNQITIGLQSDYNRVTISCIISYTLKTHSTSSSAKKKKKKRRAGEEEKGDKRV